MVSTRHPPYGKRYIRLYKYISSANTFSLCSKGKTPTQRRAVAAVPGAGRNEVGEESPREAASHHGDLPGSGEIYRACDARYNPDTQPGTCLPPTIHVQLITKVPLQPGLKSRPLFGLVRVVGGFLWVARGGSGKTGDGCVML